MCKRDLRLHGNHDHALDVFYPLAEEFIGGHEVLDGAAGVQDGGVVFAAEF
jgi:hypothetical protein